MNLKKPFITFVALLLFTTAAYATRPIIVGKTYEISEKDALSEIEQQARTIDWQKTYNKERLEAVKRYQPEDLRRLPKATEARTYLVDMTYTLDMDVPDGRGGILYPKGHTFNPLDYVTYPGTVVVIDGSDPEQIAWFKRSRHAEGIQTRLLLCDGSHYDTAKTLGRPVFYLNGKIASRFQLEAVPSVIHQVGNKMEVELFNVASPQK